MNPVTDTIWIGTFVEARNVSLLRAHGIRSIVCLDGELVPGEAEALGVEAVEVVPLIDGPGNRIEVFRGAVALIGDCSREWPHLLVHCRAGRSRSVVAVAAHLMKVNSWSAHRALEFVGTKREIWLTPGIEELLR